MPHGGRSGLGGLGRNGLSLCLSLQPSFALAFCRLLSASQSSQPLLFSFPSCISNTFPLEERALLFSPRGVEFVMIMSS